jgi:CHASE2 domain-containing sensor protein
MPLVLVTAFVAYWLHARGILIGFETLALETFAIVHEKTIPAPHVTIINITDDYYNQHFRGKYPLQGKDLDDLIVVIANGNPRLIAIDLDSSLWTDADVKTLPTKPSIVWARDIKRVHLDQGQDVYCGLGVLGGAKGIDDQFTGIAAFPADVDGIVRSYPRFLQVSGLCHDQSTNAANVQSFPWAVAATYREQSVHDLPFNEPDLILNFLGDRFVCPQLTADDVMQAANEPNSAWATQGPLRGRIALLGGTYHAAHDEHATPRGIISGVEIVAQAIETDLTGGGIRASNERRMLLLEIGLGAILLVFGAFLPVHRAAVVSLVVFVILAPVASFLSFSTKTQWANFVPMLFAAVIHSVWHSAREQNVEGKESEPVAATADADPPKS